jgi:RNase P subunit RPR2
MKQNGNIIVFPERRYGIRVGDLRPWHYVQVTCRYCGHTGRIYAQSFWRRCRMEDSLVYVVKRMRCRHCGGSSVNWDIWQIDRNA